MKKIKRSSCFIFAFIIIVLTILISSIFLYFKNIKNDNANDDKNNLKNDDLKNSVNVYEIKKLLNFKDRYVFFDEENQSFYIGKKEKEIKNNFYDVKIDFNEVGSDYHIDIYINKLFKNYEITKENIIIQDEYFNEIMNFIYEIIDLKNKDNTGYIEKTDKIFLENLIKEEYTKTKNIKRDNTNEKQDIQIKSVKITIQVQDDMLKIVVN